MHRVFALLFVACASQPAPSAPPVASLDIPKMPATVDTPPPPPPPVDEPEPRQEEPKEPTPVPLPPTGTAGAPFDKGAAAGSLGKVHVAKCASPGGPTGSGHVTVLFTPQTGRLANAVVDQGPFVGSGVGSCIARLYMQQVKVPPFGGPPVRVGKSFIVP